MSKLRKTAIIGGGAGLVALALSRAFGLREDIAWDEIDKPGSLIEVDGYTVHYVEAGSGPAIVLIHGFGGHTYSYERMMANFARDHRVIAVDLKGFGYSERDAEDGMSHTGQVRMLKGLLDRLGVERATFVGHSMGGAVVQRFAATHPEMVNALVLAASVSGDERFRRTLPAFLLRPFLPLLAKFAASRLFKASFYDQSLATDAAFEAYVRPARIEGSMDGLLAMMRDAAKDAPIDRSRITMPVLLLNGAHDRVVPLAVAQRIREAIPHARLVVIERAAHLLIDERAEECARAIRDFLAEAGVRNQAEALA